MLKRLTHKILLGALLVAACVGGLVMLTLGDLAAWNRAADRLVQSSQVAVMDGVLHSSMTRATAEAVSFAVTGNQHYAREASDALIFAHSSMAQLRRALGEPRERGQQPELRKLRQRQEAVLMQVRNNVNTALRGQDAGVKDRLEKIYEGETEADEIWGEVLAWHDAERRTLAQEMREIERRMLRLVAATLAVGTLWLLALVAYLGRAVTGPINRLAQTSERVAKGDLDQQVRISSRDEIGTLQGCFNRMVQELRQRQSAPDERVPKPAPAASDLSPTPVETPRDPEPAPQPDDPPSTPAVRRVLLVETDADSRELTRAMLQHCGMQVTVAESGPDARSVLARQAFDLVLMDCDLQAPDLAEAVGLLRGAGIEQRNVPIVALTGADVPEARERCLAAGMNDQLAKPVSFFDLHDLLARWLPAA